MVIGIRKFGRQLNSVLSTYGYRVTKIPRQQPKRSGLNLNVGCGQYEIEGFVSLDIFTEHYYGNHSKFNRVTYDMRRDNLPYSEASVDTIYASHVIEHIETEHVQHFLHECCRVLKPRGLVRIVCPDSRFLYDQTLKYPSFFSWHPLYASVEDAVACFVDEVATHRLDQVSFGLSRPIAAYSYEELMMFLREGGAFDQSNPGRHINNFDIQRLTGMAKQAGFAEVVESRYQGSSHPNLRGYDIDLSHPQMSLYIEMVR